MTDMSEGVKLTINDIARLAKVSKRTVSRVLNRSPLTKRETRDKVLAVIEKVGYVPDPQARGLAFRRSFLIGLIYDNPNAQYMADLQQGILSALGRTGFALVVYPCRRDEAGYLNDVRAYAEQQKLCGVILPPALSEDEALIAMLTRIGCPSVRIASVSLDGARVIVSHDRAGAAEAADHLAALGHRRIAHITGPLSFRSARERLAGFESGLARHRLSLDPRFVVEGGYTFASGLDCARRLLGLSPRPTAIFAGNDEMAAAAYRAAHEAGLSVPDDLSVIGFDDSPLALKIWPPLTSVLLPVHDLGRMAAEQVLALVQPGADEETDPPLLTPTLVVRHSTAPCSQP